MAANPIVRFVDGKIELPDELKRSLHIEEGSRFEIVYASHSGILLKPEQQNREKTDWRTLRGSLKDGLDTSQERAKERTWELTHDERKFGASTKR